MPDFDRYATGYQLTDWLTAPYWRFVAWRAEPRLDKALGITGNRQERRDQRRELWRLVGNAAHIHTIPVDPSLTTDQAWHEICLFGRRITNTGTEMWANVSCDGEECHLVEEALR